MVARESLQLALIAELAAPAGVPARDPDPADVLAFTAPETARILGITTAAVKSGLQRARATLADLEAAPEDQLEPTDRRARALL